MLLKNGKDVNVTLIKTQDDIDHIRKRGFFGDCPKIGDYSEYLGPTDGGYAIHKREDFVNPPEENFDR